MKQNINSKIGKTKYDFKIIKNNGTLDNDAPLLFSFSNFRMSSIAIDDFNNFYKNQEEFLKKFTVFIGKALPLLSNEKESIFTDASKAASLHLHKLRNIDDILRKFFIAYGFSENATENFLEGDDIYQLEIPFENGASRVIFQRIDNLISFLFLDPNHHIYLNKKIVLGNGSLFFEFCPINESKNCDKMNYLNTCFAFEFLDIEKYRKTYEDNYSYAQKAKE